MRLAVAAMLVISAGCKINLDDPPGGSKVMQHACAINTSSGLCTGADALTDCSAAGAGCFKYIKTNIFDANCKSSSCHELKGAGKLDLSTGDSGTITQDMAYANLVGSGAAGVASQVDPTRTLVVPGQPDQSYLLMMMQKLAPSDMSPAATDPPNGYMPKDNNGDPLCCQKLDLVERWIAAGAMNN